MAAVIALRTENLTKRFSRSRPPVVNGLTLNVQAGQVYGFLGQNGAGKTTTIRMLLDLVRPTDGYTYIFDQNPRQRRAVLSRVGALVEGAAFYPYLSGRDNLELLAQLSPKSALPVDRLLERVGLAGHAEQRFGNYSTGLKQRLGIAAALLHDPDLIILDEPTNGLDPVGMVEIRQLIQSLVSQEGKTVFLSSHLLGEVEQLCERVAIIEKGRMIREGRVAELLETRDDTIRIEVDDPAGALAALAEITAAARENDHMVQVITRRDNVPNIIRRLADCGVDIYSVTRDRQSLEDLFLELIARAAHDAEATH